MIEVKMTLIGSHAIHFEVIKVTLNKLRDIFCIGDKTMFDETKDSHIC